MSSTGLASEGVERNEAGSLGLGSRLPSVNAGPCGSIVGGKERNEKNGKEMEKGKEIWCPPNMKALKTDPSMS